MKIGKIEIKLIEILAIALPTFGSIFLLWHIFGDLFTGNLFTIGEYFAEGVAVGLIGSGLVFSTIVWYIGLFKQSAKWKRAAGIMMSVDGIALGLLVLVTAGSSIILYSLLIGGSILLSGIILSVAAGTKQ